MLRGRLRCIGEVHGQGNRVVQRWDWYPKKEGGTLGGDDNILTKNHYSIERGLMGHKKGRNAKTKANIFKATHLTKMYGIRGSNNVLS